MSNPTHEPPLSEGASKLCERVIEVIKECLDEGYTEALDELLRFTPRINLIQYLDEEEWENWMTEEEWNEVYKGRIPYPKKAEA